MHLLLYMKKKKSSRGLTNPHKCPNFGAACLKRRLRISSLCACLGRLGTRGSSRGLEARALAEEVVEEVAMNGDTALERRPRIKRDRSCAPRLIQARLDGQPLSLCLHYL